MHKFVHISIGSRTLFPSKPLHLAMLIVYLVPGSRLLSKSLYTTSYLGGSELKLHSITHCHGATQHNLQADSRC